MSIAAGTGAIAAGKTLPKSWSRPVVDSVLLPVHAATTDEVDDSPSTSEPPPDSNPCVGESSTINSRDQFAIDISYDGSTTGFSIRTSDDPGNEPADAIFSATKTPSFVIGAGRNWEETTPRGGEKNVADGIYTRYTTRLQNGQPTRETYDVTFCIATSGEGDARSMTLTLVSIMKR
jgi:hypothetical protein